MRKEEIACYKQFLLFSQCFLQLYIFSVALCVKGLTVSFELITITKDMDVFGWMDGMDGWCLTVSQMTNFRLFQTEEFADDNFEFDKKAGNYPNG